MTSETVSTPNITLEGNIVQIDTMLTLNESYTTHNANNITNHQPTTDVNNNTGHTVNNVTNQQATTTVNNITRTVIIKNYKTLDNLVTNDESYSMLTTYQLTDPSKQTGGLAFNIMWRLVTILFLLRCFN